MNRSWIKIGAERERASNRALKPSPVSESQHQPGRRIVMRVSHKPAHPDVKPRHFRTPMFGCQSTYGLISGDHAFSHFFRPLSYDDKRRLARAQLLDLQPPRCFSSSFPLQKLCDLSHHEASTHRRLD